MNDMAQPKIELNVQDTSDILLAMSYTMGHLVPKHSPLYDQLNKFCNEVNEILVCIAQVEEKCGQEDGMISTCIHLSNTMILEQMAVLQKPEGWSGWLDELYKQSIEQLEKYRGETLDLLLE